MLTLCGLAFAGSARAQLADNPWPGAGITFEAVDTGEARRNVGAGLKPDIQYLIDQDLIVPGAGAGGEIDDTLDDALCVGLRFEGAAP